MSFQAAALTAGSLQCPLNLTGLAWRGSQVRSRAAALSVVHKPAAVLGRCDLARDPHACRAGLGALHDRHITGRSQIRHGLRLIAPCALRVPCRLIWRRGSGGGDAVGGQTEDSGRHRRGRGRVVALLEER